MRQTTASIYTKLSNTYGVPYQIVEVICNHPFLFASRVMSDPNDTRTLMFQYLGKIKIKKIYENTK